MSTHDSYTGIKRIFGDSRDTRYPDLAQTCGKVDDISCSDLLTVLTVMSEDRSNGVTMNDAIRGNRFNESSSISQRDFHWLEGLIMDAVGDNIDFVELSPLQPFGLNHVLAGINQKNVISTLKRSELNADVTTALFRDALRRFGKDATASPVRVASNARVTRGQMFEEGSKFLPHFKIFGQLSLGAQEKGEKREELETLAVHLASEVDTLDAIKNSERSRIESMRIRIGSTALLRGLINDGKIDVEELRRHTYSAGYSFIESNGLDLPETLPLDTDIDNQLGSLGVMQGAQTIQEFAAILEQLRPDIFARTELYLGRAAGIGYYKHICYDMVATNDAGVTIPVADGGSTPWAASALFNKRMYTVASAIGTELSLQHLVRK